jgi:hypothetical protein
MFPLVELKGSKIVKVERPWSLEEEEAVMDGNKINSGRKRRLFKYESRQRESLGSHTSWCMRGETAAIVETIHSRSSK